MAISTYTELKTAVLEWSARSDLSSTIQDEVIDMAESLFKTAPEDRNSPMMGGLRVNKSATTGTLTSGTTALTLPSDYLEMDRLRITGANGYVLDYGTPDTIGRISESGSGAPKNFGINANIEFELPADSAYSYELQYWPSLPALGASQTTNWLLTNYPHVYLHACLYYVGVYTRDDEMMTTNKAWYREAAYTVNKAYRRGRQTRGPISTRPDIVTP